jgi:hypothetical protein
LAIPRADESCALGGSAWPVGSPGETSSGRLLVIWLGIYTFMGSRFGRAGRSMNTAASPSPLRWWLAYCDNTFIDKIVIFMDGRITFRVSKSGQTLFKQKSYQIRINGNSIGHIDTEKNTISEQLPMDKYSIEVSENDFFIRKDIVLVVGL